MSTKDPLVVDAPVVHVAIESACSPLGRASRDLSCSETASETSSSSSEEDEALAPVVAPVPSQFALDINTLTECLELPHFVEKSTRHDVLRLRNILLEDDCPLKTIRLVDQAYATSFRRYAYKKDNVNHHIQKICLAKHIQLDYQIRLDLDVDGMSVDSAVQVLQEVKKHPEVKHLEVTGHLTTSQTKLVFQTITSMLRQDDRDWTAVNIATGFISTGTGTDGTDNYQEWTSLMMRYMGLFSQLYTQYNIPVDIKPCAAAN